MYQVIARKYRPQTFADVVNQEHVKRTLTNALEQGRIGHGYIFSGPRGTGKTTLARILAKALNCEKGRGPTPCLECPACTEIAAGSAMDLTEIDAASNRRIDDIRELRENVRYRPVRDRYKVFIIDEAHQITTDAFNALLKTLEEPPEWVVFVLCTTEPQSIPATIQSRCQSFQFRTVELEDVIARMQWICGEEGVEAEDDALTAIALAGDGSIRDSLSTLDQAIASCGKKLEAEPVRDLLGAIPVEISKSIVEGLADSSAQAMLDVVDRLFSEGRHAQHFVGELTRYFRNLLVMKVSGADTRLVTAGPEERTRSAEAAERFSREDLARYLKILLELYDDLQNASQPRFRLEMGLLKMIYAGSLRPIEEALASLGSAPAAPAPQAPPRPKSPAAVSSAKATRKAPSSAAAGLKDRLVTELRDAGEQFVAEAVHHSALEESGGRVEIRPVHEDRTSLEFGLGAVEAALGKLLKRKPRVMLGEDLPGSQASAATEEGAPEAAAADATQSEAAQRALGDADVQAFQQRFPGRVREVRNLKEYSQ